MNHIFIAHGSTDHEASPMLTVTSARALATFLLEHAKENDGVITDADDNQLRLTISAIEKHLNAGRAVFVDVNGDANHELSVMGTRTILQSRTTDPVALFCQCDHLVVDGEFVGYVNNEAEGLTTQYLDAAADEQTQLLSQHGDVEVFAFTATESMVTTRLTLRALAAAKAGRDANTYVCETTSGALVTLKFLVSVAL